MAVRTKIRQQGGSLTITLPKEMADRLDLKAGDEVHVVETPDGIAIRRYDPIFEEGMRVAERGMRRYANALRKLADS